MINTKNYKIKHSAPTVPPDRDLWSFNRPGSEKYTSRGYVALYHNNKLVCWYNPKTATVELMKNHIGMYRTKWWTANERDTLLEHLTHHGMRPK